MGDQAGTGLEARLPPIAIDTNGNVVVAYQWGNTIWVRRFDSDLNPLGDAVRVDDADPLGQYPDIATGPDGRFVVVYDLGEVWAMIYDSSGQPVPLGPDFQVSASGLYAKVAFNKFGNFLVTWQSSSQIWAALYDKDGNLLVPTFKIDEGTFGAYAPAVDSDDSGNFIITYESGENGNPQIDQIFARVISKNGVPLGGDFQVNSTPITFTTLNTDVAALDNGKFVTVWEDYRNDPYPSGDVYGSIYRNDSWVSPLIPILSPAALVVLALTLAWILVRKRRMAG